MLDKIIELYQNTTGITIPVTDIPKYQVWGMRALRLLESKLGWSLDPNAPSATILGTSTKGCSCDTYYQELGPAPSVVGKCRVFSYDDKKPFLETDLFKKVHAVYVCRIRADETSENGVVVLGNVKNFTPRYINGSFGKYLQSCEGIKPCQLTCEANCKQCSAILVDADWANIDDLPLDMVLLLCDYIDWLKEGGQTERNLKKESVDGHSVEYRDEHYFDPYSDNNGTRTLMLYAGPYGAADRKLIW